MNCKSLPLHHLYHTPLTVAVNFPFSITTTSSPPTTQRETCDSFSYSSEPSKVFAPSSFKKNVIRVESHPTSLQVIASPESKSTSPRRKIFEKSPLNTIGNLVPVKVNLTYRSPSRVNNQKHNSEHHEQNKENMNNDKKIQLSPYLYRKEQNSALFKRVPAQPSSITKLRKKIFSRVEESQYQSSIKLITLQSSNSTRTGNPDTYSTSTFNLTQTNNSKNSFQDEDQYNPLLTFPSISDENSSTYSDSRLRVDEQCQQNNILSFTENNLLRLKSKDSSKVQASKKQSNLHNKEAFIKIDSQLKQVIEDIQLIKNSLGNQHSSSSSSSSLLSISDSIIRILQIISSQDSSLVNEKVKEVKEDIKQRLKMNLSMLSHHLIEKLVVSKEEMSDDLLKYGLTGYQAGIQKLKMISIYEK